MIDYMQLTTLQQAFVGEALETVPAEVTAFSLAATGTQESMQVKINASHPFVLSEKATETLREIFELHRAAGTALKGVRANLRENDDNTWSLDMELDYA